MPEIQTRKNIDKFMSDRPVCKDCKREYDKEFRQKNSDRIKANKHIYSVTHKEGSRKRSRKWWLLIKLKATLLTRNWQINHPVKVREAIRKWQHAHGTKKYKERKAKIKENEGTITFKEWDDLKNKYNHSCLRCGRKKPDIKLTMDHIIPVSLGGRNSIDNIQPLCKSCNSYKHIKSNRLPMIKSKAIRFAAEISKIQTMVDGGLRIILDTPESELPAISELNEG